MVPICERAPGGVAIPSNQLAIKIKDPALVETPEAVEKMPLATLALVRRISEPSTTSWWLNQPI